MTTRKAPRRKTAAKASAAKASPKAGRRNFLHVASRIFNTSLLIDPRKLAAIVAGLRDQMGVTLELPQADFAREPMAFDPSWDDFDYDDWMTVTGGVAVLHIDGTLVHKGAWLGSYSGLISYEGISEQLQRVRQRHEAGEVGALLLNMHTHGGEVAGCFDLVDEIYAMRDVMPITALVADAACSAGYAIASAAHEIAITQAGYAGSIGVVYTHYDYTGYAEKQGIAVTHIYAGKEKVLGSPFVELSDEDREKLQDEIDDLYEIFVAKVARNRGMSPEAVRATEAAVFYANAGKSERDAIQRGLVDRVVSPRELLAELQARIKSPGASMSRQFNTQELTMTTTAKTTAEAPAITEEQVSAARAEGKAEGVKEGTAAGASAERVRIKSILTSPEAEGRKDLASHLAFETDAAADAAVALLAKAPKQAATAKNPLEAAMAQAGTTGVGQEAPPAAGAAPVRINATAIYESRRKAAGH